MSVQQRLQLDCHLRSSHSGWSMQEEFMSAFGEQVTILQRQEQVQRDLEHCADNMDRCRALCTCLISGSRMSP